MLPLALSNIRSSVLGLIYINRFGLGHRDAVNAQRSRLEEALHVINPELLAKVGDGMKG
jgi:hypothetical protein